jgi:MYXO-CTERM domain-containing protein
MKRFVKCFVLVGGMSTPAFAQTIINGNVFGLQSGGSASGSSWNLTSNGYEGTYIKVPTAGSTVSFNINASGIASSGVNPEMTLSVAGTNVPFTVSGSNGNYTANVTLPGDANPSNSNGNGTYLVRVQLDNQNGTAAPGLTINNMSVSGATVVNSNNDTEALAAAQTYIDKFRSGSATVSLSNLAGGLHLGAGSQVQVKMISNAFNFAAAVYGNNTGDARWISVGANGQDLAPTTSEQINYQKTITNPALGINMIVPENAGKWQNNEFAQNNVTMNLVYAEDQFALQNNMRIRMHNFIWNNQQPNWVNSLFSNGTLTTANKNALNTDMTKRVGYYVSANNPNTGQPLADAYSAMDGLNEPWHGQSANDNYIGAGALGVSGVANVYSQIATAVKNAGANTVLYTNEYNVLQFSPKSISTSGAESGSDPYANWYLNGVQSIQNAGGPVGGIGMELYTNASNNVSPTQMQEAMGNLSVAKGPAGNPINLSLTEFGVATGQAPSAANYDADLQTALTMAYGNPQTTTFGYWGGIGGPQYGTNSIYALFNQNYALTSAGTTWENWMAPYLTNQTLTTDANGNINFTGTYGEYDVIINGQTYLLNLAPGTANYSLQVALPTATWNGSGSDTNWSTAGNWAGTALASNSALIFAGTSNLNANNNTAAGNQFNSITFNSGAGAFNLTGNGIALAGDVMNNSTNPQTVNIALALQQNVNLNAAAGNITVGGNISGAFGITKTGSQFVTLSGTNSYSGATNVNAGTLVVGAAAALPATTSVSIASPATLQLAPSIGGVTVSSLAIAGGGTFDLNNNHLFINYSPGSDPIAAIVSYIQNGYNGGAWNGSGIISSAAQTNPAYGIAYADSADPGNPAGLASNQIEIMYTLLGDANLDGKVNGADFAILAANFNTAVNGWDQGDFNYDLKVNGSDFANLAANFNQRAGQSATVSGDAAAVDAFAAANGLPISVPEPASSAVALAAVGLLASRRRRIAT